jgi:hypothetical protein
MNHQCSPQHHVLKHPQGDGSNRDEVTRGRTKLHNEEINNLYSSLNIVKMMLLTRMRRVCNTQGTDNR